MKKFFTIFSVAAVMAACNTTPNTTVPVTAAPVVQPAPAAADTAGLAQYKEWKEQQEQEAAKESKPAVQYAVAKAPVRKARKAYQAPVSRPVENEPVYSPGTVSNTSSPANAPVPEATPAGNEDVAMSNESANTAEAEEKKGWSKKAKGAVIGGAAGAAAGAIINKKNRAVGAVIGGVIGAGGGYVIGSKMDKKDGR